MLKVVDSPPHSRPGNRPRFHNCRLLAGNRVSQKYRRAQLRKIQRRECQNLKRLIPGVKDQEDVDQTTVIEEAIKYIDQMHAALFQRFTQGALPKHVIPEALPIIQLLQNGQLPLPQPLQQQQQQFLQQRQQQQQQQQQHRPIPTPTTTTTTNNNNNSNTNNNAGPSCSSRPGFQSRPRLALQDIQNVQYSKPVSQMKKVKRL